MGAISDLSDLINRLTGGNNGNPHAPMVWIDSRIGSAAATATVAGRWTSLWRYNTNGGGAGATPGAVEAPTKATVGAFPFRDASGGRTRKLAGFSAAGAQSGTLLLYDRLLHIGGLSGTVTTAQTVGGTLTRNTGGVGNEIWVEIYGQIGTTGTTITASYTNQAGSSGATTPAAAIGGTGLREAERIIPLALADGDTGVRAVASTTLAATTGTAGSFGITIARPIAQIFVPAGGYGMAADLVSDFPSLPELENGSCLNFAWFSVSTTAPQNMVQLSMVEA
jgi:hypothetical protein